MVVGPRPTVGLWGGFVFCFGLFFGCCWDGWRRFFVRALCWLYVGWGGMRMGDMLGLLNGGGYRY